MSRGKGYRYPVAFYGREGGTGTLSVDGNPYKVRESRIYRIELNKQKRKLFLRGAQSLYWIQFNNKNLFDMMCFIANKMVEKTDDFKVNLHDVGTKIEEVYASCQDEERIGVNKFLDVWHHSFYGDIIDEHKSAIHNIKIGKAGGTKPPTIEKQLWIVYKLFKSDSRDKHCDYIWFGLYDIENMSLEKRRERIVTTEPKTPKPPNEENGQPIIRTSHDEASISGIETIPKKRESTKAKFFRQSGPEQIDFKESLVVERKEVNEIIEQFENEDIVLIKGKPASGKSVILRNIGYKLADQGKQVYLIELKKTLPEKTEVLKLNRGYLFIEDAHLSLSYVDDILQNLSNVKILVSTRDIEETFGPTYPLKIAEYIRDAIEIKTYDAAEGIIQKFSEKSKKIDKKIPKVTKEKLTKNNLWILAWELEAYEKFKGIDENAICKRVMNYMRKDLSSKELKQLRVKKAENVFLPLSVFYKYEIPLRKDFFIEKLSGYEEDIEKLIKLNEINTFEENGFEYLALHHSEIAKVFLKAFENLKGLGNKVKEKFGKEWFEKMFHQYIQDFPIESRRVIFQLGDFRNPQYEIIRNLVKHNFNKVKKSIETGNDAKEIAASIWAIYLSNREIGKKLAKRLDFKELKDKIMAEENLGVISLCISWITTGNGQAIKRLVNTWSYKELKNKIVAEENIGSVGEFFYYIAYGNKEFARRLIPVIKTKIEAAEDLRDINRCFLWVPSDKKIARTLIKSLDFEKFNNKIQTKYDAENINSIISLVGKVDAGLAYKLDEVFLPLIYRIKKDLKL